MGNQPYEPNPAARERSGGNRPPTIANLPAVPVPVAGAPRPAVGSHQCPNCGAWAPAGSSVCGECGTRLQSKPQKIRCRLCGGQAQASLVICPHCGRELHPAPSRVLSWGAPALLVLLFLLVLVQRWESGNPLRWVQTGFAQGRDWVNGVAERLDPQITISTLPADVTADVPPGEVPALPANEQENTLAVPPNNDSTSEQPPVTEGESSITPVIDIETPVATAEQAATGITDHTVVTPAVTVAEVLATVVPTPQPTATPTTPAPTATDVLPTPTPPASATPTTSATTTRPPTLSAIVQALPVVTTPDEVTAANAEARKSQTTTVTILQPTPTDVPTQPATPTSAPLTYVVQAGDTPLGIADQVGISVDQLLALNGMSVNDARRLRVGQVLTIAAVAPSTATPTATATTVSATASPSPTPMPGPTDTPQPTTRVDAPVLRSPENGSSLSCNSTNSLVWLPVSFIRNSDQYLLHLGFLNGYNADGSEQVIWILEQWRPSNVTLWDLDEGLCGLAPQAFGRQWRWYVEVVEPAGNGWQPVSPPSATGSFSWN